MGLHQLHLLVFCGEVGNFGLMNRLLRLAGAMSSPFPDIGYLDHRILIREIYGDLFGFAKI